MVTRNRTINRCSTYPKATATMSMLLRESLEARLAKLEDMVLEHMGEPEPPTVCATCYELMDECFCIAPVKWPLPAVVYKLRAELALDGTA